MDASLEQPKSSMLDLPEDTHDTKENRSNNINETSVEPSKPVKKSKPWRMIALYDDEASEEPMPTKATKTWEVDSESDKSVPKPKNRLWKVSDQPEPEKPKSEKSEPIV